LQQPYTETLPFTHHFTKMSDNGENALNLLLSSGGWCGKLLYLKGLEKVNILSE